MAIGGEEVLTMSAINHSLTQRLIETQKVIDEDESATARRGGQCKDLRQATCLVGKRVTLGRRATLDGQSA